MNRYKPRVNVITKPKVDNNPFAKGFQINGCKIRNAKPSSAQKKTDTAPVDQGDKRRKNSNFLPVESNPQYQIASL
ncbi:unnamed protein product [Clavelina lepadiformis]|uniref:Uncharacterized protein n=1 Tax=Clavelina lepadiformis TaxID=159417 RepID=A0ABP0GFS5_CLALP